MKDTAIHVAQLMAASARTAPKAGGKDFLEIGVIHMDEDLQKIAQTMKAYAPKSTNEAFWLRDAANIEKCQALMLVGLKSCACGGYDCGACGYPTCADFVKKRQLDEKEMGYSGPFCALRMMDVGAALVAAAKTASLLNLDNRIQQRVGAAAKHLGLIDAEVVMGIPVGFYGKSIFFDRSAPKH